MFLLLLWWFVHKITVFASYIARLCTLLFFILEWHMLNSMGLVDIDTLDLETAKSLWLFLAAVDGLILMYGFCMIPSLNLQLYAWWPMSNFKVLVKLHFLDFFLKNQLNSTFMIFDSMMYRYTHHGWTEVGNNNNEKASHCGSSFAFQLGIIK